MGKPADRGVKACAHLNKVGCLAGLRFAIRMKGPKAPPIIMAHFELAKIHAHLDWINQMAYDFHGGWSPLTNFNAPLYPAQADPSADESIRKHFNVDAAVKGYLAAGVPEKLVLGVPFYGRGWSGVKKDTQALYQPHGPNLPKGTWEAGVFDYKDLAAN